MRCFVFTLALSALLPLTSVYASPRVIANEDWCREGLFVQQNQPRGAGVAGPGGAHLNYDKESCHLEGPRCPTAHVPPGGHLVLGRHRDGLICVYFPKGHDSTSGWVKAGDVRAQPIDRNPSLRAWLGLWLWDGNPEGDPYIRFWLRKGLLRVKGQSWNNDDHIGDLDERVRRTGYRAYDARCNTTFWLIGPFLAVDDDHYSCFGPGADFDGIYVLKHR